MIKGIGTDLVSTSRIAKVFSKHGDRFARKILGFDEYPQFQLCRHPVNFLSKRFSAKEATAKALGTGFSQGISWKDIQVKHNLDGKPEMSLSGGALRRFEKMDAEQVFLSLSDEQSLVIAYVVIE